jgi:hypothetical protein
VPENETRELGLLVGPWWDIWKLKRSGIQRIAVYTGYIDRGTQDIMHEALFRIVIFQTHVMRALVSWAWMGSAKFLGWVQICIFAYASSSIRGFYWCQLHPSVVLQIRPWSLRSTQGRPFTTALASIQSSPTRGGPAPSLLLFSHAAPPPNLHLSPLPVASVPLYLGWVCPATA